MLRAGLESYVQDQLAQAYRRGGSSVLSPAGIDEFVSDAEWFAVRYLALIAPASSRGEGRGLYSAQAITSAEDFLVECLARAREVLTGPSLSRSGPTHCRPRATLDLAVDHPFMA